MQWQQALPYTTPLIINASMLLMLAVYTWRRRSVSGGLSLFVLAMAAAEWALGYALEISTVGSNAAYLWARVQYLGIMTIPVAWFVFALSYSGQSNWMTRPRLIGLCTVPVITNLLVWTNDYHHFIWPAIAIDTSGIAPILAFEHGAGFWVCNLYAYALLGLGTIIIIRAFMRIPNIFLRQAIAISVAVTAPWLGNIIYVLNIGPVINLDFTPFAFSVAAFATTLGVWRYRFLDIAPVARSYLFEQLEDGILLIDARRRLMDCNATARTFLALPSNAIGQPIMALFTDMPLLLHVIGTAGNGNFEITIPNRNGDLRVLAVQVTRLEEGEVSLGGQLVVWRDITERTRAEERLLQKNADLVSMQIALREALDKAEQASQTKSRFLAQMSHEFRTPLSAMLGYVHIIQLEMKRRGDASLQDDLGTITLAGNHLLRLINNLLDLNKMEAGKSELHSEAFDLVKLVHEVATSMEPLMLPGHNTFHVTCPATPIQMTSDATKLRQVLLNLLGNSAKFTEEGRISLTVALVDMPGSAEHNDQPQAGVKIEVTDNGIGIPQERLNEMFEPFTQGEALPNNIQTGTGLGLHITKRYCQMMGGDIQVNSVYRKGSTFTVIVPRVLVERASGERVLYYSGK